MPSGPPSMPALAQKTSIRPSVSVAASTRRADALLGRAVTRDGGAADLVGDGRAAAASRSLTTTRAPSAASRVGERTPDAVAGTGDDGAPVAELS